MWWTALANSTTRPADPFPLVDWLVAKGAAVAIPVSLAALLISSLSLRLTWRQQRDRCEVRVTLARKRDGDSAPDLLIEVVNTGLQPITIAAIGLAVVKDGTRVMTSRWLQDQLSLPIQLTHGTSATATFDMSDLKANPALAQAQFAIATLQNGTFAYCKKKLIRQWATGKTVRHR